MVKNNHPFSIWRSKDVAEFLVEFYQKNFRKAGIDEKIAEELVWYVFDNKHKLDEAILMKKASQAFNQAKKKAINFVTEPDSIDLIDLNGVETFLDIGANKLATINHLAVKYKQVRKFIAVDITPQSRNFLSPERGEYFQVEKDDIDKKIEDNSIDFINAKFVLHHFNNLDEIKKTLKMARRVIKEGGTFFLFEETFQNKISNFEEEKNLGFQIDNELTNKFYNLTDSQKWEFIIANDWLINVSNPHMPWTRQFRVWEEWVGLFSEFGFKLEKQWNLGLRVNGRLKQGVHIIGQFVV